MVGMKNKILKSDFAAIVYSAVRVTVCNTVVTYDAKLII